MVSNIVKNDMVMKTKKLLGTLLVAIVGGLIAVFLYSRLVPREKKIVTTFQQPYSYAKLSGNIDPAVFNFVEASKRSVEAVVHVKTQSTRQSYNPILEFFYGDSYRDSQPVLGFGSGVIISDDGYIVTNNHVVENSDKLSVTLNDKREFDAKVIGTDPSTDLALLKIDGEGFQYIPWGNSDSLQVGEWVLAVGNPFNLTSTAF